MLTAHSPSLLNKGPVHLHALVAHLKHGASRLRDDCIADAGCRSQFAEVCRQESGLPESLPKRTPSVTRIAPGVHPPKQSARVPGSMLEWPHLAKHLPRGKPPSAPGTVWMILPWVWRVTDHLLSVAGQSFSWRAASTGGPCQDRMTGSARSTDTRWTSTRWLPVQARRAGGGRRGRIADRAARPHHPTAGSASAMPLLRHMTGGA